MRWAGGRRVSGRWEIPERAPAISDHDPRPIASPCLMSRSRPRRSEPRASQAWARAHVMPSARGSVDGDVQVLLTNSGAGGRARGRRVRPRARGCGCAHRQALATGGRHANSPMGWAGRCARPVFRPAGRFALGPRYILLRAHSGSGLGRRAFRGARPPRPAAALGVQCLAGCRRWGRGGSVGAGQRRRAVRGRDYK